MRIFKISKKNAEKECKCHVCEIKPCEKEEKPDIEAKIYNILEKAEKVAVKLAQINQILKKSAKKKKKKNKKLGKVDKKTGTLILKTSKKMKVKKSKALKRHK